MAMNSKTSKAHHKNASTKDLIDKQKSCGLENLKMVRGSINKRSRLYHGKTKTKKPKIGLITFMNEIESIHGAAERIQRSWGEQER